MKHSRSASCRPMKPIKQFFALSLSVLFLSLCCKCWGAVIPIQFYHVVVPNELTSKDGNSFTMVPFLDDVDVPPCCYAYNGPFHYQQVYAARAFPGLLPTGGAFINVLALNRGDCGHVSPFPGQVATNTTITFSTTTRGPDELSMSFAQNLGPDALVVTNGMRVSTSSERTSCTNPEHSIVNSIFLPIPFFYNPLKGNLLMDLKSSGIIDPFQSGRFDPAVADAQNLVGDDVSRIYSHSLSSAIAEFSDTTGLVSFFEFLPIPTLYVTFETNTVVLAWQTKPAPFNLQSTDQLRPKPVWSSYSGSVRVTALFSTALIPQASLAKARYFRLFWNSPQPGVPQVAPVVLGPPPSEAPATTANLPTP